jgi:hypothetical protein
MPKKHEKLKQLNRKAAAALFLYAGFILGFCFLVVNVTAWSHLKPAPREPFYTTLPGVNMQNLPPEKEDAVLKKLNALRCRCECMRTVASCRNHHSSCSESTVAAQQEVDTAERHQVIPDRGPP